MQVSLVEWCVAWVVIGYALSILFSSDDDDEAAEEQAGLVQTKSKEKQSSKKGK